MKIERIDIAKFRIPLRQPARAGPHVTESRTGRLIRIEAADGCTGYGEATPLPGVHDESLEEVDRTLAVLRDDLAGRTFEQFPALAQNVANRVTALGRGGAMSAPSACFGVQTAGMALFAHAAGTVPADLLSEGPSETVFVNGYFDGDLAAADRVVEDGSLAMYTHIKVKIGRRDPKDDVAVIETLLGGLPDQTLLRLDANRSMSLDQALQVLGRLPPQRIEYVEEPLENPADLPELNNRTGLAVALDESLRDPSLYYLGRAPFVAAWIVKPSLVGHWQRVHFLAGDAQRSGAYCVVTSCVESGLGLWALVQMVAALPGERAVAGLGTDQMLEVDTVEPPYDSSAGYLETRTWQGRPSPNVRRHLGFPDDP